MCLPAMPVTELSNTFADDCRHSQPQRGRWQIDEYDDDRGGARPFSWSARACARS